MNTMTDLGPAPDRSLEGIDRAVFRVNGLIERLSAMASRVGGTDQTDMTPEVGSSYVTRLWDLHERLDRLDTLVGSLEVHL